MWLALAGLPIAAAFPATAGAASPVFGSGGAQTPAAIRHDARALGKAVARDSKAFRHRFVRATHQLGARSHGPLQQLGRAIRQWWHRLWPSPAHHR